MRGFHEPSAHADSSPTLSLDYFPMRSPPTGAGEGGGGSGHTSLRVHTSQHDTVVSSKMRGKTCRAKLWIADCVTTLNNVLLSNWEVDRIVHAICSPTRQIVQAIVQSVKKHQTNASNLPGLYFRTWPRLLGSSLL